MKKLASVLILAILLFSILMLSLPVVTFAQDEDATEAVETTDTDDIYGTAGDIEEDSGGTNVAVWIGIGVAMAAGVGVAIRSGSQQKQEQEE